MKEVFSFVCFYFMPGGILRWRNVNNACSGSMKVIIVMNTLAEKNNQIYSIATRHVCNHIIDCLGIIACSQTNTKTLGVARVGTCKGISFIK